MENSGCLWDELDDKLLNILVFKYDMNISEIAELIGRSENATRLRLMKLGLIKKTTDNFVWERFKKKIENTPSGDKSKAWELLCETLSEIIDEKCK